MSPSTDEPNGDGNAKEPGIHIVNAVSDNSKMLAPVANGVHANGLLKSSAPFPSPVPTSWAMAADMNKVRANTPLGGTFPPRPTPSPGPPAPPPPHAVQTPHVVQPVPKPARTKSDASTKAGKTATVFKRMFGGGSTALPQPLASTAAGVGGGPLTPEGDLNQSFDRLGLPPNGQYVNGNGTRTPSSERADPVYNSDHRGPPSDVAQPPHTQSQNRSRTSSVKGRDRDQDREVTPVPATPTPVPARPSSRASSTDGRFNLKDLLGSGQKLSRRSSASSRRSDSSVGDAINGVIVHGGYTSGPESAGRPKSRAPSSVGGDSATSLSKKYGFCEKQAIGKGATSVVRLAHKWDRSEEKLYAVKEFRKRRKNETEREYVKKLTAEFCISSTLHHPNVVETVDLVQDEHQNWCEVMEYCPGGDLYAAIKRGGMSASEVECSFKQILLGLQYLHSQGVAHRDIKPENLFFDAKGQLKIGDYGASTVYRLPWESSVHMSTGLCGSEPYIAPEQFHKRPYDARLVDIWACGIVYYCLHFQELPWRVAQMSDPLFSAYVASCQSRNPSEADCPATINNLSPRACRPLLRKMLEPRPEKRILIEDIMKDSWISSIEVCIHVPKPKHIHVHARQVTNGGVV